MNHRSLVSALIVGLWSVSAAATGDERPAGEVDRGRVMTSPVDWEGEGISTPPEKKGSWETRSFGKIVWREHISVETKWSATTRDGVSIEKSGRTWLFWLEESESQTGDTNFLERGETEEQEMECRPKRVNQLDQGTRPFLWIEFDCKTGYKLTVKGKTARVRQKRSLWGNAFVLDAQGTPICVAKHIPVIDGTMMENGTPAQIDVDFDATGHMIIAPRTKHVSPEQKKWIGKRLVAP